jgi:hypothetical protein
MTRPEMRLNQRLGMRRVVQHFVCGRVGKEHTDPEVRYSG